MKPTEQEIKIQTELFYDIAISVKAWSLINDIPFYGKYWKVKGKVHTKTIDTLIREKKGYLTPQAMAYLASKTNLSIRELVNYYRTNISDPKLDSLKNRV